MQDRDNGEAMKTDTTGMIGDDLLFHNLRKKHSMQDIKREEIRREAEIAAEGAEGCATADAADVVDGAARAAAIVAVGADATIKPVAAVATLALIAEVFAVSDWNGVYLSDESPLESEVVRGTPLLYD